MLPCTSVLKLRQKSIKRYTVVFAMIHSSRTHRCGSRLPYSCSNKMIYRGSTAVATVLLGSRHPCAAAVRTETAPRGTFRQLHHTTVTSPSRTHFFYHRCCTAVAIDSTAQLKRYAVKTPLMPPRDVSAENVTMTHTHGKHSICAPLAHHACDRPDKTAVAFRNKPLRIRLHDSQR